MTSTRHELSGHWFHKSSTTSLSVTGPARLLPPLATLRVQQSRDCTDCLGSNSLSITHRHTKMSLSYMRPTAASSARAATTTTIASTASKLPQRLPGWVPSMPKPSPKGLSLTLPRPSEESLKRVDAVKARGKYQGAINGWRADFGKLLLHANLIKAVLKDWEQFAEVRPPTVDCTLIPTTSLGVRQESSSHNVLSPVHRKYKYVPFKLFIS